MHIDSVCVSWFIVLQAIQEQMKLHGQEPVSFQDVKVNTHTCAHTERVLRWTKDNNLFLACPQDEIFDMVKPKDPYKITLQDLVNSCQGDIVTSILIDLNGFWTYENREVLVANDNDSSNTVDLDDTWSWFRVCSTLCK